MQPIRVLIADDHAVFRYGLRARLGIEPGMQVVGEAASGQEAIDMAARLAPDVIVMDVQMPGVQGIEATRRIRSHNPQARVLILTQFDNEAALAALRAGARGYLLKDEEVETIVEAVRAISRGQRRYSATVDDRLHAVWGSDAPSDDPFKLTPREREVLQLMVRGLTNAAIAAQLSVEEHTVRNYVSEIYSKLGLEGEERTRRRAILRAVEAGLGE